MDVAYNRHAPSSRRSHPSLNHLSLAPLTPKFPIADADELPDPNTPSITYRSSYIEGRSAPTTPSILSRSSSRTRLKPNKSTHALKDFNSPVSKSKSSVSITLPSHHPARPKYSAVVAREDSEWLHRAGALISTSTRESKGQSWLATRSSSTSLVDAGEREDGDGEVADDEFSPVSRRNSASRPSSRYASARNSRRGSRVGSKVESLTPMGAGTSREVEGREGAFGAGPDFVDGVEEEEGESAGEKEEVDEIELQRLTREKGFGLGGWVDNLIGWTLFRVDDDERKESDGKVNDKDAEEVRPECKARGKRQGSERVMVAPSDEDREVVPPPEDGEGGWQDAAWLLSVASKIIL